MMMKRREFINNFGIVALGAPITPVLANGTMLSCESIYEWANDLFDVNSESDKGFETIGDKRVIPSTYTWHRPGFDIETYETYAHRKARIANNQQEALISLKKVIQDHYDSGKRHIVWRAKPTFKKIEGRPPYILKARIGFV